MLFSGSYYSPLSIAAFLQRRGLDVDMVDNDAIKRNQSHDLLDDIFFEQLYESVRAGAYHSIFAAPPCSTYSVSPSFNSPDSPYGGPPIVRSRDHILGLPDVPPAHRRELERANEITRRTAILLTAAHRSGSHVAVENPADRGDPSQRALFQLAEHGSIWKDPYFISMRRSCHLEYIRHNFSMHVWSSPPEVDNFMVLRRALSRAKAASWHALQSRIP